MSSFAKQYGNSTCAFGFPLPESSARTLDKYLDENPECSFHRHVKAGYEYFIDGERADVSILTDRSLDHDNEVIEPTGVDWKTIFQQNPVVAFDHNYKALPLGRSVWQKLINDTWKAKTVYHTRPDDYPKNAVWPNDNIWHLIKTGFLPAKSVGYLYVDASKPTPEEISSKNIPAKTKNYVRKSIVLEYSVVTVGANHNAIVQAVSKSVISLDDSFVEEFFPEIVSEVKAIKVPSGIKGITLEEYNQSIKSVISGYIDELLIKTPDIVEGVLDKLTGKV